MFEPSGKLAEQITTMLEVLRGLSGGRYACLADSERVLFESADDDDGGLRQYLEARTAALFRIPARLAATDSTDAGDAGEDVFADWGGPDGFFLAFINRRIAAVVACPEPEELQEQALKPLKTLAERVFQWNPSYRSDGGPLSLFFNRPRLDLVVVGRPEGH